MHERVGDATVKYEYDRHVGGTSAKPDYTVVMSTLHPYRTRTEPPYRSGVSPTGMTDPRVINHKQHSGNKIISCIRLHIAETPIYEYSKLRKTFGTADKILCTK